MEDSRGASGQSYRYISREIREVIMANPRLCLFFEDDNLIKLLGLTDMLSGKRVSHDRIIQSALNQGNSSLLKHICYLFEKFELPRRRKRDEDDAKNYLNGGVDRLMIIRAWKIL